MQLTRVFIEQHKTARKAWTKAQIEAIGIEWPPRQGWIDRAEGVEITDEQRRRFIEGRTQRAGRERFGKYCECCGQPLATA